MDQQPEFTPRIGTFSILVGIGLMVVFLGSSLAGSPHYGYLLISLGLFAFGVLLRRRAKPRSPSGRFRTLGKLRGAGKDKKEKSKR